MVGVVVMVVVVVVVVVVMMMMMMMVEVLPSWHRWSGISWESLGAGEHGCRRRCQRRRHQAMDPFSYFEASKSPKSVVN